MKSKPKKPQPKPTTLLSLSRLSQLKLLPPKKSKRNHLTIAGIVSIILLLGVLRYMVHAQRTATQTRNELRAAQGLSDNPQVRATCELPTRDLKKTYPSPETFSPRNCQFGTYSIKPILIKELDQNTCRRISKYFIADKNHVYKQIYDPGSSDLGTYTIIKEADPQSFVLLKDDYYKDASHVFYDNGHNYKIIENVDAQTVQVLSYAYLKNKKYIYFNRVSDKGTEQRILSGFDVETFESLSEQYFKDKNGVYYEENIGELNATTSKIPAADPDTFETLNDYLLAKDKNRVYHRGKILPNIDAPSFEVLNGNYYRDAYTIYVNIFGEIVPIADSDVCTFELVGYNNENGDWSGYAKDKNRVYYREHPIEGSDPASFQLSQEKDKYGQSKVFDKTGEYQGKYRK